jgi:uncharacterized repeat protein (TIGR03803 family)
MAAPPLHGKGSTKRTGGIMKRLGFGKVACVVVVFCAVSGVAALGQTFATVASFDGTNGSDPYAGSLVQGANGDFYGTTAGGGANNGGTIFEVTSAGTVTTFYSFCAKTNCRDGQSPFVGLTQTANGDFYGTTWFGGADTNPICNRGNGGCGTVFEISPEGRLITLHNFCAQATSNGFCTDGAFPLATLVQGYDGDFYGTTEAGNGTTDEGTVFKLTPTGTFSTLFIFPETGSDGSFPQGTLVRAADGKIYGTTSDGGASGGGTVFSITPGGELTTLYNFCSLPNCADGAAPAGGLVQATNGNFYGTTVYGGANDPVARCTDVGEGCGTIFEITPAGTLKTLYSFCSQPACADGQYPVAGLIQATDGNFYGVADIGGNIGADCNALGGEGTCGTIFEITPTGTFTTLYSFCSLANCADGANPIAALLQGTDGNLYGTTTEGGSSACTYGCGTVFSLSMGLAPFVEALPTARGVGQPVTILGNNLTGTTGVSFNGTAATLITVSDTAITTTVPTGATTGTVQVVTPSGTLSSNVPFRVIP